MKSSSIFTDTFAPVTLPSVILASINASESGCLIGTLSIKLHDGHLGPPHGWNSNNVPINGTNPVEVNAEFLTGEPFRANMRKIMAYTTTALH